MILACFDFSMEFETAEAAYEFRMQLEHHVGTEISMEVEA